MLFRRIALSLVLMAGMIRAQSNKPAPDTSQLTREERVVLEYLQGDWQKQYRTTSIGLAGQITKTRLSDESRLRLAKFIDAHRTAYAAPSRHRTTTVALTPKEKLTARAILLVEAQKKAAATREDIARVMGVSTRSLDAPLKFLQAFGVLSQDQGYRVDPKYPRRPSRFIDFFSHQVEVNQRDRFEVA